MKTTYKGYIIRQSWNPYGTGYDFHAWGEGELYFAYTLEEVYKTIDELTKQLI